jgi:hypothetical protein
VNQDLVAAADLRARAREALAKGRGASALDLLDQARALDPAGDTAPEVAALRVKAKAAEAPAPKPPSGRDKP